MKPGQIWARQSTPGAPRHRVRVENVLLDEVELRFLDASDQPELGQVFSTSRAHMLAGGGHGQGAEYRFVPETKLKYLVTHAAANVPKSPIGIDSELDLEAALALAGRLISERRQDVMIADGDGRQISGEDLAACCRGEKKLTADLQAV